MDLKKYRSKLIGSKEERAVSPVIGVILMVAITVILAAVIAAFVLDIGNNMGEPAPTTAAEIDMNSDWQPDSSGTTPDAELFYLSHSSGDSIANGNVKVILRDSDGGEIASLDATDSDTVGGSASSDETTIETELNDDFGAGATLTVSVSHTGSGDGVNLYSDLDGEVEVQLVDSASDTTVTTATFETDP
ncbi:type IV pilin [Natribaculum luteum]|uniref:Type IV pilin n=1 Tax=Natribaculum luteum TaxID=1586232 RepID=A0ABD5NZP0_9EURY|nr:type IV pilin N-terminal domain-containing protein [Natribaculum luteum]